MKLMLLSLLLFLSSFSTATSCGTTTITSQSDADTLSAACQNITGDVILYSNISGPIDLSGIQVIQGSLYGGPCDSNCTLFTSLTSSTLNSISGKFSLDGISNITSIEFPQLQSVGGAFVLNHLDRLQNLSLHDLSSVGQFNITSAPNLSTLSLEHLQNVTGPSPSVEVTNVALASAAGLNPHTSLTSFILRDVPNLLHFTINTPRIDYLEIRASPEPIISDTPDYQFNIDVRSGVTFNISKSGRVLFGAAQIDHLLLSRNWFRFVQLSEMEIRKNLSFVDNWDLQIIDFPNDMSETRNLQIVGNSRDDAMDEVNGWPWNMQSCESMVFQGNISDVAFKGFLHFGLVEVSNGFSLQSTDQAFDCTFLNSLRSQGYFQGSYECQGQTLPAGPVRKTADVKRFSGANGLSISMFGCLFSVTVAFTVLL